MDMNTKILKSGVIMSVEENKEVVRREIEEVWAKKNLMVIAFTPVGYPADQFKPKMRRDLTELIRYEKW